MYPDFEFLPRAPDPEEIIFGDNDEDKKSEDTEQILEKNEKNSEEIKSDTSKAKTKVEDFSESIDNKSEILDESNILKTK